MNQTNLSIINLLDPYKRSIDQLVMKSFEGFGNRTELRDACEYALSNGGKRFRPALVFMVAKALGYGVDVSQAALAVEYFHTASLIADDLPCMDDDDERRNKPSVHKVYGESIALLATYALISAGYGCLAKNARQIADTSHPLAAQNDHLCLLALENAAYNTGILGATGGQLLDLSPPDYSLDTLNEIIDKKTVTLFEISFVFGWIFGGGKLEDLPLVKRCAGHFGRAFQIADDLGDLTQDGEHNLSPNMAKALGVEEAKALFYKELNLFNAGLEQLSFSSDDLKALQEMLIQSVQ